MPMVKRFRKFTRRKLQPLMFRPTASDRLQYNYCYIYVGNRTTDSKRTFYIGKTPYPYTRYRQHHTNTQGAWRTRIMKNKQLVFLVGGLPTERYAEQCEWRLKHPYTSKSDRPKSLEQRFANIGAWIQAEHAQWTHQSYPHISDYKLQVWVRRDCLPLFKLHQESDHLTIHPVDIIDEELLQRLEQTDMKPEMIVRLD